MPDFPVLHSLADDVTRALSILLTLLVFSFLLGGMTSCDRFKNSADENADPDEEEPLDPEAARLNEMLENPEIFEPVAEEPAPVAEPFVLNKAAQVSILCYHNFTEKRSAVGQMDIHIDHFAAQMEALANAEIPVIPMADFLLWRKGQKNIPDPCVVITMDDGWESVHRLALPVLRKHGYPFTIYLYKKYVNIGGRSLSLAEIQELREAGAEIGSHAVTHTDLTQRRGRSDADYRSYLIEELRSSKEYLSDLFGEVPASFAYPFGTYNDHVAAMTIAEGYEAGVTVNGRKCTWEDPPGEIGRFVIHGNSDTNFKIATSFRGRGNAGDNQLLSPSADPEDQLVTVYPSPEQTISSRLPIIVVDVTRLGEVVPGSVGMRVAGFGEVVPEHLVEEGVIRYQVPTRLRNSECFVQVSLKRVGEDKPLIIPWKFFIEPQALYLNPPEAPAPSAAATVTPPAEGATSQP